MNNAPSLPVQAADHRQVTYYDLPAAKPSPWGWLVSGYIFVGGLGGSAQVIATAADLAGDPSLAPIVRRGRYIALASALVGGPLLIIDLRTPQRWYNMLRIFRKTSPMSIGTWVLIGFGVLSAVLAALQFAADRGPSRGEPVKISMKLLQLPAALAGMAMSTYTGALLSSTSTPLWAAAPRRIAAVFGASAMASAAAALSVGQQMRGAPGEASRPLDHIALAAAAAEILLLLSLRRRWREQRLDGALDETGWGLVYDFGVIALGAGVPVLHHGRSLFEPKRPPRSALVISLAILAGGFLLRHVLLKAGNSSARRPRDYFRFTAAPVPGRSSR